MTNITKVTILQANTSSQNNLLAKLKQNIKVFFTSFPKTKFLNNNFAKNLKNTKKNPISNFQNNYFLNYTFDTRILPIF